MQRTGEENKLDQNYHFFFRNYLKKIMQQKLVVDI